jgi:hypothetical protein
MIAKAIQDAMPLWSRAQARVEKHMKQYVKTPTNKRLIEAPAVHGRPLSDTFRARRKKFGSGSTVMGR